jgi:xylulose-5-phosphate/fructose-6-phosphate phosphoketolase
MEMLSEHTLEGWLGGYLLTGRHGFFSTYESFVHIIDSMVNQHCKWLEICKHTSWREEISALNLLITPRCGGKTTTVLPIKTLVSWTW